MKLTKFTAILAVSAISSAAVAVSLVGVAGVIPMAEAGPTVWYHYAKIDPTEEVHGSKEFWAKASESCSTVYFEAPGAGATVLERDFSGNAYFTQLEHGDARYIPSHREEQERLGQLPKLSVDGKTVTYGLYPQKRVSDSSVVSALNSIPTPESNGYYLYQDTYYAKTVAQPNKSNYVFDDGTTIVSGTTYWFECEPITWKVLSSTSGTYYVLSEVLLDAHRYNEYYEGTKGGYYANNYLNSEIRAWLNGDFYGSAFALADSAILTTTVDNSASTTDSSSKYACANTQDKVFLPSYKDCINSSYGFSTSTGISNTRYAKPTDWARARGASYYPSSGSYQYNGCYWTRSPDSDCSSRAWYVNNDGYLLSNYVYYTGSGVRPSLSIVIV